MVDDETVGTEKQRSGPEGDKRGSVSDSLLPTLPSGTKTLCALRRSSLKRDPEGFPERLDRGLTCSQNLRRQDGGEVRSNLYVDRVRLPRRSKKVEGKVKGSVFVKGDMLGTFTPGRTVDKESPGLDCVCDCVTGSWWLQKS